MLKAGDRSRPIITFLIWPNLSSLLWYSLLLLDTSGKLVYCCRIIASLAQQKREYFCWCILGLVLFCVWFGIIMEGATYKKCNIFELPKVLPVESCLVLVQNWILCVWSVLFNIYFFNFSSLVANNDSTVKQEVKEEVDQVSYHVSTLKD